MMHLISTDGEWLKDGNWQAAAVCGIKQMEEEE